MKKFYDVRLKEKKNGDMIMNFDEIKEKASNYLDMSNSRITSNNIEKYAKILKNAPLLIGLHDLSRNVSEGFSSEGKHETVHTITRSIINTGGKLSVKIVDQWYNDDGESGITETKITKASEVVKEINKFFSDKMLF